MEAAHFETKLIRSVLIEVVILSKLESTYFTSDTSTTGSGQKIKKYYENARNCGCIISST